MHARTGPRAKYLGATVYKYVPDEIDQRVIQWGEGRKRRSGGGGRGGESRARTEPSDDEKIFGRRANFHSTVNTRRAEAEKLVRERRK